jgi:hypothetical protein
MSSKIPFLLNEVDEVYLKGDYKMDIEKWKFLDFKVKASIKEMLIKVLFRKLCN